MQPATTYAIALVFFGFSIMILGYLIFESGYLPRILSVLLVLAAFGYLIDSFARVLLPTYDNYETLFGLVVFAPRLLRSWRFACGFW